MMLTAEIDVFEKLRALESLRDFCTDESNPVDQRKEIADTAKQIVFDLQHDAEHDPEVRRVLKQIRFDPFNCQQAFKGIDWIGPSHPVGVLAGKNLVRMLKSVGSPIPAILESENKAHSSEQPAMRKEWYEESLFDRLERQAQGDYSS